MYLSFLFSKKKKKGKWSEKKKPRKSSWYSKHTFSVSKEHTFTGSDCPAGGVWGKQMGNDKCLKDPGDVMFPAYIFCLLITWQLTHPVLVTPVCRSIFPLSLLSNLTSHLACCVLQQGAPLWDCTSSVGSFKSLVENSFRKIQLGQRRLLRVFDIKYVTSWLPIPGMPPDIILRIWLLARSCPQVNSIRNY